MESNIDQSAITLPENFTEFDGPDMMSNFDHSIHYDTAEIIKGQPLFSRYSGWEFNGKVWWDGNNWHCEVWRYGSHVETVSFPTLEEIMTDLCDKYGSH